MKYLLLVVLALGFGLGAHEPKAVRISKLEVKSAVIAQLSPDRSDLVIFANDDFVALETQFKSKRSFNDAVQTKNPIVGELHRRIEKLKKEVAAGSAVGASRTVAFKIASQNEVGEFTREVDLTIVSTKTSPILLSVQVTVAGLLKPAESLLNAIKSVADESTVLENHGGKLFLAGALTWFYFWKTQNYPAVAVRAYDWVFADKPLCGMPYDKETVKQGIRASVYGDHKELEMLFWDDVESVDDITSFLRSAQPKTVALQGGGSWTFKGIFVVRMTTLVEILRLAGKRLCRHEDGGFSEFEKRRNEWFNFSCGGGDESYSNPLFLGNAQDLFIKNGYGFKISFKAFFDLLSGRRNGQWTKAHDEKLALCVIDDLGNAYTKKASWLKSRRISSRYWGNDAGYLHCLVCDVPRLGIGRCIHQPFTSAQVKSWLFGYGSIFGDSCCPSIFDTQGNLVDLTDY